MKPTSSFKLFFLFYASSSFIATAGLLKERHTKPEKRTQDGVESDVLILGAGMAGINAAKTLFDAGITNFKVLEATNRIGGRVLLHKFKTGGAVELGANWVHGPKSNPIWKLVDDAKLGYVKTMIEPTENAYIVIDENGVDITAQDGHERMKEVNVCVENLIEKLKEGGKADMPMRTALGKCNWLPTTPAETSTEYFYHDFDAAVSPEEISSGINLRSDAEIDSTGDEQLLISDTRGYAHIIENLANNFPKGSILFGKVVQNIVSKEDRVDVFVQGEKPMTAKFVLATFSIGVLRNGVKQKMFGDQLPTDFRDSLEKMNMANYLKIFLKFSVRFWPSEYQYFFYASKKRGYYPVWQNLPGSQSTVLLVTVTGEQTQIFRGKDEKTMKEQIENDLWLGMNPILKKVFATEIGKLEALPQLLEIELKNWENDERFFGAYSNPSVGIKSSDFDALLSPVRGRLFFAGEGLSELYYGFLHGAYITGEDQAKKIIGALQFENGLNQLENMVGANFMLRGNTGNSGNETVIAY